MFKSKTTLLLRCMAPALLLAAAARAEPLLNVTGALNLDDPTQMGRLYRDGLPSDWSAPKAFPGVTNPSISYRYQTYLVGVGITPYIQISVDDSNTAIFASVYLDDYAPADMSLNYLGDAGSSGNPFGNPAYFQVIAPIGHNLVLVINDTGAAGAGVGRPFGLLVEGFIDSDYSDPAAVPEPAAMLLAGGGMALLALFRRGGGRRAR